ncbi:D-Tyr tRNAtyr deacylase-like domain-containing protein [Globomyces pollinis-pini]|nr:D-Tyr tRNAtyr deacylase-like domain-containing protein [Globomyces pollinis-pini]
MRVVIQRVKQASVIVDGEIISSIGKGFCLLVGIKEGDEEKDIDYMVKKILSIKLFENEDDKFWKENIQKHKIEILSVSQFTLYAKTTKGTKPDFHLAMKGEQSSLLYSLFLSKLRDNYQSDKIKDGKFGAMMDVSIVNDGPVTILLDTDKDS